MFEKYDPEEIFSMIRRIQTKHPYRGSIHIQYYNFDGQPEIEFIVFAGECYEFGNYKALKEFIDDMFPETPNSADKLLERGGL